MESFDGEREQFKKMLQEVPGSFALTTDIWTTDTNDKSFMSVTVHFLNTSWKIKHVLLDFISMDESHTGIAIANAMENWLRSMNIVSKLIAITCDNASANNKFLLDFSNSISQAGFVFDNTQQSIRCFGHVLNLAVQSMLKIVEKELEKLRGLIKSIRASRNRREKLKLTSTLKPILDVVTRWNSTFDICERALKL